MPVVCVAAADRAALGAGHRMRTRDLLQKDFEHGRFHPLAQVFTERLIEERVFTT